MQHPEVAEAAAVGIYHPKWSERPLLVVVKKDSSDLDKTAMLDWYADKIAKWWIPEDVVFVDELPHAATGKLNKIAIREQFSDHYGSA
jgi:fatty-acyl-CoA synthase